MLQFQYFYLISMLLCIHLCFCYDYINEENGNESKRRSIHAKKIRQKKDHQTGHKYLRTREPVAEIDVADFIQPDYDVLEEEDSYSAKGQRDKSKNYNDYGLKLEDAHIRVPNGKFDYASLDVQDEKMEIPEWTTNNINLNENPTERVLIHKQKKKYSLKFPFFSHKKASTIKPKKGKKHKTCARCTKTSTLRNSATELSTIETRIDKMIKRSYSEQLCPLCQRKLVKEEPKKAKKSKQSHKMFHDSKQYYQQHHISKDNQPSNNNNMNYQQTTNAFEYNYDNLRIKRDSDSERQLKELDAIQRKVDNVVVGKNEPRREKLKVCI